MTTTNDLLTMPQLLALLDESRQLLADAASIEDARLPATSDAALRETVPYYAAAIILSNQLTAEAPPIAVAAPPIAVAAPPVAVAAPPVAVEALPMALAQCAETTEAGYRMAVKHLEDGRKIISATRTAVANISQKAGANRDSSPFLEGLQQRIAALEQEHRRAGDLVEKKRRELQTFNITLFGRTMSGKSTLMEILTNGDGSSIGTGAQRTTRDVRSYPWQGLTVTDVPGIAAFEGQTDEETAHDAAEQADLILFLISDDAPQPAEAEHLARLRQQGRHVLGIHNVKRALDSDREIRYFLVRDQQKLFAADRLRAISRQFDEMADRHTPGRELELTHTHLRARYLSRQPEYAERSAELEAASRFYEVERRILDEVSNHGPFLRRRNFLDSAVASTGQITGSLHAMSEVFQQFHLRLADRNRELQGWLRTRSGHVSSQIDRLVQQTVGDLRRQINDFVEEHFEDKQLHDRWNERISAANLNRKMQEAQRQLAGECQERIRQLTEDMQQEIGQIAAQFQRVNDLETGPITDTRGRWNWGVTGLSSTLGLGAAAALFIPVPGVNVAASIVLGVAAGAVGLVGTLLGRLFGNRDQKRREAIEKITPELQKNLDDIERQMRSSMNQWWQQYQRANLDPVSRKLNELARQVQEAANQTRASARRQNDVLLSLNRELVTAALQHLGYADAAGRIDRVDRQPGRNCAIATADGRPLPADAVAALGSLLNESITKTTR